MKKVILALLILMLLPNVYALTYNVVATGNLDSVNVYPSPTLLSGDGILIIYESDTYTFGVGDLSAANKATLEIQPELGTEVVSTSGAISVDLDKDDTQDIKVRLLTYDATGGPNADGELGSVTLSFERVGVIGAAQTTQTIATTSTTETTIAATNEVVDAQPINQLGLWAWIVIGLVVLGIILLLIILRKKIFKGVKKIENIASGGDKSKIISFKGDKSMDNKIKCQKCNKDIIKGDKFCIHCGANLKEQSRFCPECGSKIKEFGKFCPECGHKM